MKNLLLSMLLIFVFGCQLNGQDYSGDELGITSPKSFSTFIKSIESNSNLLSEGQGYKQYKKVIVKNNKTFTVQFMVTYDKSKNKIPYYQGNIILVQLLNSKKGSPFTISTYGYSTYKDLIIGEIVFNKNPINIIPNSYSSIYALEIKKEKEKNENSESEEVESEEVESEEVESEEVESEEIKKAVNEIDESKKYSFIGVRSNRLQISNSYGIRNIGVINNFLTLGDYSILSNPIIIQEEIFWENNGTQNLRGNGYTICFNEKTMIPNDTITYQYYKNGKKNGRITNYNYMNNTKVEMENGTYKDNFPIGEYTNYKIEPLKYRRVLSIKSTHDQNGFTIKRIIYNSLWEDNKKNPTVYIEKVENFNPKTTKLNGIYEEYQSVIINGSPLLEESGFYSEGNRTGIWKKFYRNGQLDELINYTTGQSEKYNYDGSLVYKKYKN
jgi:5-hydroxyisourate hydrolase-like protein (transthyretin family)